MNNKTIFLVKDTQQYSKFNANDTLSNIINKYEEDDFVIVSHHPQFEADHIVIYTKEIKNKIDGITTGGKLYTSVKNLSKTLEIEYDGEFNSSIKEGIELASYEFTKHKSDYKSKIKLSNIVYKNQISDRDKNNISESINWARDLVNEPGNILYPAEYANRIKATLEPLGVKVTVFHQEQLKSMGFELLLSVGQGSTKDSYVVVMEWNGGNKKSKPIAFVGKGVTFDTGGISIKPSAGMGDMKMDMGGSGAVVGAMHAIASKNVQQSVVGIVGLVENMPDGNSIKPGDVVTSLSGLTVENLNTDAEGRLVLADLLTYVQQKYEPTKIIDLATLTGAILVSLGNEMAGLFSNSTELANTIEAIGANEGELFWRMPMGKNWSKMLDSDIADIKNIGGGRYGGSTTAAEFLYKFVNSDIPWAHLDIAGTAWTEKPSATNPRGATGFGVRTLFEFTLSEAQRDFEVDEDMSY